MSMLKMNRITPDFGPYTCKPLRTTWFGRTEFGIYFEDTLLRTTNMVYDDVVNVIALLNGAWLIGYGSGHIQGERSVEKDVVDEIRSNYDKE